MAAKGEGEVMWCSKVLEMKVIVLQEQYWKVISLIIIKKNDGSANKILVPKETEVLPRRWEI